MLPSSDRDRRLALATTASRRAAPSPHLTLAHPWPQVAPGTYLLEVLDTQSMWPTVRLEVSSTGKARALLSHSRQPLPFPLPLEPLVAKPSFFEKREGFQWSAML